MHMTYVALHEVTWCMVVWCTQNLRRDGSSFMWHQPCQCCKYTTSVDIQKRAIKTSHSCRITCERSVSARERRIALYKIGQQQQVGVCLTVLILTARRSPGRQLQHQYCKWSCWKVRGCSCSVCVDWRVRTNTLQRQFYVFSHKKKEKEKQNCCDELVIAISAVILPHVLQLEISWHMM